MLVHHQLYLILFAVFNLINPKLKGQIINFSNNFTYELTPIGNNIEYYIDSTFQLSNFIENYSDPIFSNSILDILLEKPPSINLFKDTSNVEPLYSNILIAKPSISLFSCNEFDTYCSTILKDEYKQEYIYYGTLAPITGGGFSSRGFFSVGYEKIDNLNENYIDFYIYIDDIFLYFFFDINNYNNFIANRDSYLPSYMRPCMDGDGIITENCPEKLCTITEKLKTNHY